MELLFEPEETKDISAETLKKKHAKHLTPEKKRNLYQRYIKKLIEEEEISQGETPRAVFTGWVGILDAEGEIYTPVGWVSSFILEDQPYEAGQDRASASRAFELLRFAGGAR